MLTPRIAIDWNSGRPHSGADDDEARAIAAAEASLAAAGISPADAFAAYREQFLELDDEAGMTGAALAWIAASKAADIALTEGWHNPSGASCSIDLR